MSFFQPLSGYFPLVSGNIFFFPPYVSYRRLSAEVRQREATIIFLPPPPPSDPTLSPSFTHHPETTPFVQSLPLDSIYN